MQWRRIKSTDPEIALEWVRNSDATTLAVGHAVLYDGGFCTTGATTYDNDGVGVVYSVTTPNAALFAGIVADRAIVPLEYGWVQKYGVFANAYLTGAQTAPFQGYQTALVATSFGTVLLRPWNAWGANSTQAGYLGVMALITQIGTAVQTTASNIQAFYPGGYCIPMGYLSAAAASTLSTNSTGPMKVFINCFA